MIGKNIKRFRIDMDWSQAELARRSGILYVQLSRYEHGKIIPSELTLKKIAAALGVTTDQLKGKPAIESAAVKVSLSVLRETFDKTVPRLDEKEREFLFQALELLRLKKDLAKRLAS